MTFDANKINTFLLSIGYQVGDQVSVRCLPAKTVKGIDKRTIPNLHRAVDGVKAYGSHTAKVGGDWEKFKRFNEIGFAVYLVVNPGGEKDSDITSTRVMFWECDAIGIGEQKDRARAFEEETGIEICAAVQTKKSIHFYIPIQYGQRLDDWMVAQKRLIQKMDSDRAIWNPSRLMRLPEFDHTTWDGEEFQRTPVRLLRSRPYEAVAPDALEMVLPELDVDEWNGEGASDGAIEARLGVINPFDMRNFAHLLEGYNPGGRVGWITCKCPAHNGESNDSLHINVETGRYICHSGCDRKAVWKAAREVASEAGWTFSNHVKALIVEDWDAVREVFGDNTVAPQALFSWVKMKQEDAARSLIKPELSWRRRAIKDEFGKEAYKKWEDHAVTMQGLTWEPGEGHVVRLKEGGYINLHKPYMTGRDGDVTPWLDHVKWILPNDWKLMIDFLAFTVRHPGIKINWGIFWVGQSQGTGKDTLLSVMPKIMGNEYKQVSASALDPSKGFNGYLAQAKLLLFEEMRDVNGSGSHLVEHLKAEMASAGREADNWVVVNEKYQQPYRQRKVANYIFGSNHPDALAVKGERRFVVMNSPVQPKETAYYDKLYAWLAVPENVEAVAHFLQYEWDLTGFNPKARPADNVSAAQVQEDALRDDEIAIMDAMEECGGVIVLSAMLGVLQGIERGYKNSWLRKKLQRMGYVVSKASERKKIDGETKRSIAYDPTYLAQGREDSMKKAYEIARKYYREHTYLPGSGTDLQF